MTIICVYTHLHANLDAAASLAIRMATMPYAEFQVHFMATPPEHNGDDIWMFALGNDAFDHHQLQESRSTCAAALRNQIYLIYGNPV